MWSRECVCFCLHFCLYLYVCVCVAESTGRTQRKYEQLSINSLQNTTSVKAETPMIPPALRIWETFESKSTQTHKPSLAQN